MGKLNKIGMEKKMAFKAEMKQKRKQNKASLKAKRAKLIVSNLPFKSTEENLRQYFEKFGDVETVNVLKKTDGKMVGCAFVQYKIVQHAAQARHYLNGKPFLGRNLTVDFAKPKNKYTKEAKKTEQIEVKEENDLDLSIVKEEDVKKEVDSDQEIIKEDLSGNETDSNTEDDNSQGSDEDVSEESDDDFDEEESHDVKAGINKKPRTVSNDVSEGKTIFIKNVPFDATNEDLKQCMLQYGPLYYALICVDKITEHSKGTAFVKFRYKEDADKCLEAGTELQLLGNTLDCHPALSRNDLKQKETDKKKKVTDSRNLYLVKEGVILAGTKAAEGVSATDMAKRLQLEQYKTQMLRNLNMFVSRNRLVVHNLPTTWDDSKFRALLKKHSAPKAIIREAKVMRDLRDVDSKGVGRSKEFGFATFTSHEDALKVLRSLNNNPNIFSAHKRPIVAFSIENKSMVKGKERRLKISKQKNPQCKEYDPSTAKNEPKEDGKRKLGKVERNGEVASEFSGVAAKPGAKKMRSRYNLKTQAKLHYENMKKDKKKKKQQSKTFSQKKEEFRKQEKQKVNRKTENDSFSKLVNKYKQTLITAQPVKKAKWYE